MLKKFCIKYRILKIVIYNEGGLKLITYKKGGKINEEGTALLVDSSKNHKQWAKYINKLADDADMLKKLQDNLYNFVKDRYSLAEICKQRVEFYKSIVNKE